MTVIIWETISVLIIGIVLGIILKKRGKMQGDDIQRIQHVGKEAGYPVLKNRDKNLPDILLTLAAIGTFVILVYPAILYLDHIVYKVPLHTSDIIEAIIRIVQATAIWLIGLITESLLNKKARAKNPNK
ncbi:MAG: hypothetical protein LBM71_04435 [Elusimicrobiota bacterium]|jgi:hypothetical protein|nr:hypothetical protein [Elusimicrobiota bacterium]